jgi:hypothetical protein
LHWGWHLALVCLLAFGCTEATPSDVTSSDAAASDVRPMGTPPGFDAHIREPDTVEPTWGTLLYPDLLTCWRTCVDFDSHDACLQSCGSQAESNWEHREFIELTACLHYLCPQNGLGCFKAVLYLGCYWEAQACHPFVENLLP